MPGRKPHKESKTGCYNCKKRRVKCDEQGPPCSRCTLHDDRCVYPSTRLAPPPPGPHVCICRHDSPSQLCQSNRSTPPKSDSTPRTNTLELELWHKWTLDTYNYFTNDKPNCSRHNWQVLIPKLALQCDYLRNAILAISAMHIVFESSRPSSFSPQMLAALEYHNAACQVFQDVKSQTNAQTNGDDGAKFTTVVAFSVITLAFALRLSQCHVQSDQATGESASVLGHIMMLLSLLQRFASVVLSNIPEFSRGPLPITLDLFSEPRWQGLDEGTVAAFKRLRAITDQARDSQSDHEVNEANSQALLWLEKCFAFYSDDNKDVILMWPTASGMQFIQMVERGEDEVSLLLLMHSAVLLHRFGRGKRFSRGLGSKLADELSRSIPKKDAQWEESIQWVQQQVELL